MTELFGGFIDAYIQITKVIKFIFRKCSWAAPEVFILT